MKPENRLKALASYLQDRGFVYGPAPEIYGGVAGFYDYGPLGKALKNNVENTIRKVFMKHGFFEVECPTVLPKEVWEASGHLQSFTDPIIKDTAGNSYRVDSLIEEFAHQQKKNIPTEGKSKEALLTILKEHKIPSPSGKEFVFAINEHNLMMKTSVGLNREVYNRPETATTSYLPFLRYLNFFRDKLPFGIFQIGKAYRNEISPRQFLIRMREFTQAEAQLVIFKQQKNNFEKFASVADDKLPLYPATSDSLAELTLGEAVKQNMLKNEAYAWTLALVYKTFLSIGIPPDAMRFRQHHKDELAFYAEDAWDLEMYLPSFGWTEICGVHDRKDYDLTQHSKHSNINLCALTPEGKKETPHVLEIAFGTDRPTFALLDIFYEEKEKDEGKTTLALPYHMAPIPVCVFPLVNKLDAQAQEVFEQVQKDFLVWYDKSGSVGKRYLRADSMGVPFCVTYDFDTLEKDNKVTIRDRDTGMQKRVSVKELNATLTSLLAGIITLAELE